MAGDLDRDADIHNGNGGPVRVFGARAANGANGYVHVGTYTYLFGVYRAGRWELHAGRDPVEDALALFRNCDGERPAAARNKRRLR